MICVIVGLQTKRSTAFSKSPSMMEILKSKQTKHIGIAVHKLNKVRSVVTKIGKEVKLAKTKKRKMLSETVTRLAMKTASIVDMTGITLTVGSSFKYCVSVCIFA